jgi:CubicO group peptidase (beta-lactamase class C family)
MTLVSTVAELSRAAGYAPVTPLVAGISMRSGEPLFFAQGAELDGAAFGAESVADAASLAKQITGACAVLLEHEGALDPEASIAEWVPELPPWCERVRVRHLIHHTAGLPDVWPQMQDGGESDWTSRGVLAALAATPELDREPGTTYEYSSVGYVCLASIIERISGSTLDRFAQSRLFEPLGMKSSCFWTGPSAPPTAAVVPEPRRPAPLSVGDGGLWTSVSDLLRWSGALLDDALGVTGTMHTPGRLDDGTPLDYAWGVRVFRASGQNVHSHGGSFGSATAKLVRLPDCSASFAVLALDSSVERMVRFGDALQQSLIEHAGTL